MAAGDAVELTFYRRMMKRLRECKTELVLAEVRSHILETYTREQLLGAYDPAEVWDRLRNYEMEERLEDHFGGAWCIAEWCPFNGKYCKWDDYASVPQSGEEP